MSHAQNNLKADLKQNEEHLPNHEHISEARGEVFDYGKNSFALTKSAGSGHDASVERDGAGNIAALNFDHDSLYGDYWSSGIRNGPIGEGGKLRDQSAAAFDEQGRTRTKTTAGADDMTQSRADNMTSAAGDEPKGSVSDYGNGKKEYSEQLPPNWGSMSDSERQAWQAQYQERANKALHINNEPRLGVDPETGVWTGYAGEEPTEAEKARMKEIEDDPRRPHAL